MHVRLCASQWCVGVPAPPCHPSLPHSSAQPHTHAWLHLHPATRPHHPTCPHRHQECSNFHPIVASSPECATSSMGQACHIRFPPHICWAFIFGFGFRGGSGGWRVRGRWLGRISEVQAAGLETPGLSWSCGCWAWMIGTVPWPLV